MADELRDTDRGSLELRMVARAKLADPSRPPNFIFCVVKPRWENGRIVQPPIHCDSQLATVGGREIRREAGESYEQFKSRVASYLPVNGLPGFAVMEPLDSELPKKPTPSPHA